jgi:hypothetical protein
MFTKAKRNSMVRRIFTVILTIMLVTYNIPVGVFTNVFAQNGDSENVFTLQIVDNGTPIQDQVVSGHNTSKEVSVTGTTDSEGIVAFPDITSATFGENNLFQFSVGEKVFEIQLVEGTTDRYICDVATGSAHLVQTPPEPVQEINVEAVKAGSGTGTVRINNQSIISSLLTGIVSVIKGVDARVQITPDANSEIKSVKIGGQAKTVTDKSSFNEIIPSISVDTKIEVEFAIKNYEIKFNRFLNGTIKNAADDKTINPNGDTLTVLHGSDPSFIIAPSEGYHIESIKVGETPIELPTAVTQITTSFTLEIPTIIEAKNIFVVFALNNYTITFNSNENGSLTNDKNETIDSAGGSVVVEHGSDTSFTVIPNTGFHIESIKIDQEPIELPSDVTKITKNFSYTFTNVTENHRVAVIFAINTYKVTSSVTGGNGSVSLESNLNDGDEVDVNHGGEAIVKMTPDDSYKVASITVNEIVNGKKQMKESFTKDEIVANGNFQEDDNGTITYTVGNILNPVSIEVMFEKATKLEGPWSNYVSFNPVSGSGVLIDNQYVSIKPSSQNYNEGSQEIYVYSKDTKLNVSAIDPYNRLNILSDIYKGWESNYQINTSTAIKGILVKTNRNKNKGEVNFTKNLILLFDKESPVVNEPELEGPSKYPAEEQNGDTVWYSGAVTVNGKINNKPQTFIDFDYSTDIEHVYYTKGPKERSTTGAEAAFNPEDNRYSITTVDENYQGIYSIWAVDKAGNVSDVQTVNINIDKDAPTLIDGKEAVTFVQKNDNYFAKLINLLTLGTFFNKEIEVTVTAVDHASGIKDISLVANPKEPTDELPDIQMVPDSFKQNGLFAQATFKINADEFEGTIAVDLTDNVNNNNVTINGSPTQVTEANSNISAANSGIIMIEKEAPTAEIAVIPGNNVASNGNQYNGEVTFDVTVQDAKSGINTVVINVNGKIEEYDYSGEENPLNSKQYKINTADLKPIIKQDGSFTASVYVIDNAGNVIDNPANSEDPTKVVKTIYIDRTNPDIKPFIFAPEGGEEKQAEDITASVELTEYGFYFKKATNVKIKAEDPKVDFEHTSNVQSITIYLRDYENGKYFAALSDGTIKEIDQSAIDTIEPIATADETTFKVPASFKGQIFAKATDNVSNTGAFVTPEGTVIEDEEQHAKEAHISFKKADTSFKDNNNVELYSNNVDVNLTVTDTYSGLSEIEWSVVAPYDPANNQSGIIKINNDRTYTADSNAEGWEQTRTELNLAQEMTKTIKVTNNSNAIVVKAKMTDRSGNVTEEKITLSIDKTAPTIDVTYDNNTPDKEHTDFYKEDRTATIVVTERNFKPEDVVYAITNTDGVIPKLSGWTTKVNAADPDKTTHTATVKYTADGDYTFDIKYKDNAGNAAAPFAQHKFTLDKTIPEIKVSYNNNSAANGNYYKADRTATITINEHNFNTSRIKVTGTATDNGTAVSFPATSGWSTNGDVHTATIHYAADAKYSFDIDYTDMAGNIAADYKVDEFYVDQTAPELTISGVEDKSANKGDVIPVVAYSDTNFKKDSVSIKIAGANRGTVKLDGSYADAPNGQVFTFKNFEKDQKVDDIYTLSATLTDFAGNETKQTIQFSVNRFGSVYVFDDSLKKIDGKYVKKETDVIVTETNVDRLKHDSINVKMTKNGTPTDLVEGKDHTVTEAGGGGSWSQYKYVINKERFSGDGKYTVALYSEDAAGNINETIDEKKKAEISFGIDKTAPVIVPIDFESGEQYPVDEKPVTVSIKDNLVLEDATIYLNGKKVKSKVDGENYTFTIPSSNSKQNVKITAVDAAGNELDKEVDSFLVSTNLLARWYNNTPVFYGSIGGVGILSIAAAAAATLLRKRKTAVEEN